MISNSTLSAHGEVAKPRCALSANEINLDHDEIQETVLAVNGNFDYQFHSAGIPPPEDQNYLF